MNKLIINAKNILDCEKGKNIGPKSILIEGNKIAKIGRFNILKNTPIIYINDKYTVLPGLINCHVHLCLDGGGNPLKSFYEKSSDEKVIDAKRFIKDYLDAGITTIRDLGTPNDLIIDILQWIKKEKMVSPDIISSGYVATKPNGHGLFIGKALKSKADFKDFILEQHNKNFNWIKFMISGGVHDHVATNIEEVYFSKQLYEYAINFAHQKGLKTTVHVANKKSNRFSVECGIDCIEHGTGLDDFLIEKMIQKQIYLCPTVSSGYFTKHLGRLEWMDDVFVSKQKLLVDIQKQSIMKAIRRGVKIVAGTDSGTTLSKHGCSLLQELILLNSLGMSKLEALRAATINAADMLYNKESKGNIAENRIADIIVVEGYPLDNLRSLGQTRLVIKEGIIYKNQFIKTFST